MSKTDHLVMPEGHMEKLYSARNPLVRYVHRQRLRMIAHYLPQGSGLRVLDAGCGEGHLLEVLHRMRPTNEYFGVDITKIALVKARERCPFAHLALMDLSRLRFENEFFDVVISTEVLEHIIEYEEVAGELKRVLKRGGTFIVTFPNEILWTMSRFFLRRRPVKILDHVNSFTPNMMRRVVGLPVTGERHLPFPLPFSISLGTLMRFQK